MAPLRAAGLPTKFLADDGADLLRIRGAQATQSSRLTRTYQGGLLRKAMAIVAHAMMPARRTTVAPNTATTFTRSSWSFFCSEAEVLAIDRLLTVGSIIGDAAPRTT